MVAYYYLSHGEQLVILNAMKSYYQLLNLDKNCRPEHVKKRFEDKFTKLTKGAINKRKIARIKELHEAYTHLIDPVKRHRYDVDHGIAKSVKEEASWRRHYAYYTSDLLEKDLKLANRMLEQVTLDYQNAPATRALLLVNLILIVMIGVLLLVGKHYLAGGDPTDVKGVLAPIGLPDYVTEMLPGDDSPVNFDENLEKDSELIAPEQKEKSMTFKVPQYEQKLLSQLSKKDQLILKQIFDDITELNKSPNAAKINEACQIYFEEVSIASELKVKYTAIHKCLISNLNK